MNEIDMKNVFIKILKFGGIYEDFIKNFGKDFWAEVKYSDGWSVDTFNNSFDYYECDVRLSDQKITYYFEVMLGTNYCYYNQKGAVNEPNTLYDFVIVPGFKTPDWAFYPNTQKVK